MISTEACRLPCLGPCIWVSRRQPFLHFSSCLRLTCVFCTWQWYIYGRIFPRICRTVCPKASRATQVVLQATIDQVFVFPAVYFPLFYGIQAVVDPRTSLGDGVTKWRENLFVDCSAALVWAPIQLFNFGFLPVHWRPNFISGAGFLWTAYLSTTRGNVMEQAPSAKAQGDVLPQTELRRKTHHRSAA